MPKFSGLACELQNCSYKGNASIEADKRKEALSHDKSPTRLIMPRRQPPDGICQEPRTKISVNSHKKTARPKARRRWLEAIDVDYSVDVRDSSVRLSRVRLSGA